MPVSRLRDVRCRAQPLDNISTFANVIAQTEQTKPIKLAINCAQGYLELH